MSYQQYSPSGFNVLAPVVKNLLIINGILFLATLVLGDRMGIDLTGILGLHYFASEKFMPHQFITYMFMHGGITHILFNMFALWMFGNVLENFWGAKRFLIYYMITGIGAALIHMLFTFYDLMPLQNFISNPSPETLIKINNLNIDPEFINNWLSNPDDTRFAEKAVEEINLILKSRIDIPTVGASGSVFGILLAFGMMFPNTLLYLYFAIPIKAKYVVIGYGLIELYMGIRNDPGDNIAHFAHLGGMLFGFILIRYWKKSSNRFY